MAANRSLRLLIAAVVSSLRASPLVDDGRLTVVRAVIHERRALFPNPRRPDRRRKARLISLDELAVEQDAAECAADRPGSIRRNRCSGRSTWNARMMWNKFSSKRLAGGLVVEVPRSWLSNTQFSHVARRTDVAARVAADAARKLPAPERVALFRLSSLPAFRPRQIGRSRHDLPRPARRAARQRSRCFLLLQVAHFRSSASAFFDRLLAVDGGNAQVFACPLRDGSHAGNAAARLMRSMSHIPPHCTPTT